MVVIDVETLPIEGNPLLEPPKIIGAAVKINDRPTKYHTGLDLEQLLHRVFDSAEELVFHNAPFDLSVICGEYDIEWPSWDRIHDTVLLAYLEDPQAKSLGLKDLATSVCGIAPDERDELRDWIFANVSGALRHKSKWGRYIYRAPKELVAKYACMDVDMTCALFQELHPKHAGPAYDLERELMPHLCEATRRGVRLDTEGLEQEQERLSRSLASCTEQIHDVLGDINLNSSAQLIKALEESQGVTPNAWPTTPKGNPRTDKEAIRAIVKDKRLRDWLLYHRAATKLQTYCKGWLKSSAVDGRLHPNWHQTRGENVFGTRTGRLSSSDPNLQNVPNPLDVRVPDGLEPLPQLRRFVLPEEGEQWISIDYDAQEMRLLAHFAKGRLAEEFAADPGMDPHAMVRDLISRRSARKYSRKAVKGVGFGIMYGMGNRKLAQQLGVSTEEAGRLRDLYLETLPEVRELSYECERGGLPKWGTDAALRTYRPSVTTLHNRHYQGELGYYYKLLNYKIQGSAADQTKAALRHWFRLEGSASFTATVHDEINISAPSNLVQDAAKALRHCMERGDLSVPVLTTSEIGPNWGDLRAMRTDG